MDLAVLSRPKSNQQQPVPEFLQDVVKELMQLQGLHIELLTESEEDGCTIPLTVLANEDGEIDLAFCIEDEARGIRLRRAAVFALKRDRDHVSIVLIESSPAHLKLYLTTGGDPQKSGRPCIAPQRILFTSKNRKTKVFMN